LEAVFMQNCSSFDSKLRNKEGGRKGKKEKVVIAKSFFP